MDTPITLFRKRHIPQELLRLDDDEILYLDPSVLITRWKTLHPRNDFASGISLYDFKNHWKITRVARADGSLFQWYCDIMKMHITKETASYLCEDLLIDIVIDPSGAIRVLDLDEAADAFDQGLIPAADLTLALRCADALLQLIRDGGFTEYEKRIERYLT